MVKPTLENGNWVTADGIRELLDHEYLNPRLQDHRYLEIWTKHQVKEAVQEQRLKYLRQLEEFIDERDKLRRQLRVAIWKAKVSVILSPWKWFK